MRPIFVLFLLSVLLPGCRDSGSEPVLTFSAETAKTAFTMGEPIVVTISNETNRVILLQVCCNAQLMYYVDRLEAGTWTEYKTYHIPCPPELGCPSLLIYVSPSHPHQSTVGSGIDEQGTYRFRFLFSDDWMWSNELASNPFTVR